MKYSRRLDILESALGRKGSWFLEKDGERLAALVDVRYPEMFWDSYRVEIITADPEKCAALYTDKFWMAVDLVFRDREFGEICCGAMPAINAVQTLREEGRISMRWLWLPVVGAPWHSVAIWVRRRWRRIVGNKQRTLAAPQRDS
jgi:hypothetical protein